MDTAILYSGKIIAGIFLIFVLISAFVRPKTKWLKKKLFTNIFIGLFTVCFFLPSVFYLLEWPPLLGREPFRCWNLVGSPLHWHKIKQHWPTGLYYPVAVYNDEHGQEREYLLLDNLIDPMNFSGISLHVSRAILHSKDPQFQLEMGTFLINFVKKKLAYGWERDSYILSDWLLGPFRFPTANQYKDPRVKIHPDWFKSIRIYQQPWCKEGKNYQFNEEKIEWCSDTPKILALEFHVPT